MKPLNPRIHRIDRNYFWIAFIACIAISAICEFFAITSPTNVKVTYVDFDSAGNAIETIKYTHPEWLRMFAIVLIFVLHLCYMIPLIIKRFHDVGYSTQYAIICIILIPVTVGVFLIVHVGCMSSDAYHKSCGGTSC